MVLVLKTFWFTWIWPDRHYQQAGWSTITRSIHNRVVSSKSTWMFWMTEINYITVFWHNSFKNRHMYRKYLAFSLSFVLLGGSRAKVGESRAFRMHSSVTVHTIVMTRVTKRKHTHLVLPGMHQFAPLKLQQVWLKLNL